MIRECLFFNVRFAASFLVVFALLFAVGCRTGAMKTYLEQGEQSLKTRQFEEAAMLFKSAVDIDPDSAIAHWGLARAYENLGRFTETVGQLRKVVELDSANLEAKTKLGNYFLAVQPPAIDEAIRVSDEVTKADPRFIDGVILRASIAAASQKPESEVMAILDEAVAVDPARTETYLSIARYQMTLDKMQVAEETIKKGIDVNKSKSVGLIEYGRFLTYDGRPDEAQIQFEKAVEVEPSDVQAREELADFYLSTRKLDKAEAAYKGLVELLENSPESRLKLAEFYSSINQQDDAITICKTIIEEKPEYVRARYRLGDLYLEKKETALVNEQLDALFKINDRDIEALMLRARLKMRESRPDEAITDLETVLKNQPSQREALYYIAQSKSAVGQIEQARAFIGDLEKYHPTYLKTDLLKIQTAFSSGDARTANTAANALFEKVSAIVPTAQNPARELADLKMRALTARGLSSLELGNKDAAKADLIKVAEMTSRSSSSLLNLARFYTVDGDLAEAQKLYHEVIDADASNFDAISGSTAILRREGKFDDAHKLIDGLLAKGDKTLISPLNYLKGELFVAQQKHDEAENAFKAVLDADPEYLPAYSAYAALLVSRGRTDEAIANYKQAAEKKPSASVETLIAMLSESAGDKAGAEERYRKALELDKDSPIAANNLAWLITETGGNLDEALQLSQSAVNSNQSTASFYDTLGWVYLKKELYPNAVEQFKRAVVLEETDSKRAGRAERQVYRVRLASALTRIGDKTAAKREIETALANGDQLSADDVQTAKGLLATL